MSKRSSISGDSPFAKKLFSSQDSKASQSSEDYNFTIAQDSDPPDLSQDQFNFLDRHSSTPHSSASAVLPSSSPSASCPDFTTDVLNKTSSVSSLDSAGYLPAIECNDLPNSLENFEFAPSHLEPSLGEAILQSKAVHGISNTAMAILEHGDLKEEIKRILYKESHHNIKDNLKKSKLCANKNDRQFLLSLSPKSLCQEFQQNSPHTFLHLVTGILGISDPNSIFENQFLLNNICLVYSTLAKVINRKAVSYALLQTTAARDGGLREDSIKLFPMLVHPRTSQKYDKDVLAKDWDEPLKASLEAEKEHFKAIYEAIKKKDKLEESSPLESGEIDETIKNLVENIPKQVQCVWDNLNLRTKHRFQRQEDDYSKNNFDWMASIFIKDRISVNHMDYGNAIKM